LWVNKNNIVLDLLPLKILQMKKFIAVLTLFFAFTVAASAQEKKLNNEEAAKLDAHRLSEYLELKGTQQDDFISLFVMKYQVLNDPSMSAERKTEMSRIVELKVRASLTPEQIKKLEANPALLAKVIGGTEKKTVQYNATGSTDKKALDKK
jgi:hypothetical protein